MKMNTDLSPGEIPSDLLGLSAEATAEEIRAAYLRKVKEFPPDLHPAEFELIRDAYLVLRDPRRRLLSMLAADPDQPIASLLSEVEDGRRFVGPRPWLEALKER